MTAVSAICLLWACYLVFKDRAACCCRDFVLPFSYFSAAPRSTSGPPSLFRSAFAVKRPLPLRFSASPRLASASRRSALLLPVEGARNLLRFRVRRQLTSSTLFFPPPLPGRQCDLAASRGCGFYHRRIGSPLRFVDFVFRLSARPGRPTASAASLSRT